jgi:hypothetical protein
MRKGILIVMSFFLHYTGFTAGAFHPFPAMTNYKENIKLWHQAYGDTSDRHNQFIKLTVFCKNSGEKNLPGKISVAILNETGVTITQLTKNTVIAVNEEEANLFEYHLPVEGNYSISYSFEGTDGTKLAEKSFIWKAATVNFAFAFTTPHRITLGPPDDSHRTLVDVFPDRFKMSWSYDKLAQFDPFPSYRPLQTQWKINCLPTINGAPFEHSTWSRLPGNMPSLQLDYSQDKVKMSMEGIGASSAAILKINIENRSNVTQKVSLKLESPTAWMGINPAWVDTAKEANRLLAGWQAPADKFLLFGLGADKYPVTGSLSFIMEWSVEPGQTKSSWLIRPYDSFNREAKTLSAIDWNEEFEKSRNEWVKLLQAGSRIIIPDSNIVNAYTACLSDLFIMREPIAKGYIGVVPGTEVYRTAPNSCEPAIVSVAFDRAGYHRQAEDGFRVNLDLQEKDGNWTEPGGWANTLWGVAGYKAWQIMQHFVLTKDTSFLTHRFPQLLANSRFQENQRSRTRVLIHQDKPLTYGLMPRGMGDGGLSFDDDLYGVFYMHNIWAVYADSLALWAAGVLDKKENVNELRLIYNTGKNDLVTAMNRGKITEPDGTEWISSSPGKTGGSRWGVINALYPTGILPTGNNLIEGTIKYVERKMSIGGIHVHTGWMKDGMWVALSLDNFAEAYLYRGESEKAAKLLYATVNHGTPFFTWCEERGQEPGSTKTSGDLQHLWTPVALVRYVREALVLEVGDTLHLALGADPLWINSNKNIGVENAPTPFGNISYTYKYDKTKKVISGKIKFSSNSTHPFTVLLHTGINGKETIVKVNKASKAFIDQNGKSLYWTNPEGEFSFKADIKTR